MKIDCIGEMTALFASMICGVLSDSEAETLAFHVARCGGCQLLFVTLQAAEEDGTLYADENGIDDHDVVAEA